MRIVATVAVGFGLLTLPGCGGGRSIERPVQREPISAELVAGDPSAVDRPVPTVPRDTRDTFELATTTTVGKAPPPPSPPTTSPPTPPQVPQLPSDALFDTNSAVLKHNDSLSQFATDAATYSEVRPLRVIVIGHTDSRGGVAENQILSMSRARAVADFLVSKGLPAGQANASGQGESSLLNDDHPGGVFDEKLGQLNRRVEIQVITG